MRNTRSTITTQTTFPFDPPACDEPLTGDRTRIVRITVAKWSDVPRKVRAKLRPVIGSYDRKGRSSSGYVTSTLVMRRLRWTERGECTVVDGSAAHAELVAALTKHDVAFTQQTQAGRWCIVGGHVVMHLATLGDRDTAATILPVGMPVFARRGSRWTRWRGAPALWPYDRVLIDQIARVA
jgi:hypothetical protein